VAGFGHHRGQRADRVPGSVGDSVNVGGQPGELIAELSNPLHVAVRYRRRCRIRDSTSRARGGPGKISTLTGVERGSFPAACIDGDRAGLARDDVIADVRDDAVVDDFDRACTGSAGGRRPTFCSFWFFGASKTSPGSRSRRETAPARLLSPSRPRDGRCRPQATSQTIQTQLRHDHPPWCSLHRGGPYQSAARDNTQL